MTDIDAGKEEQSTETINLATVPTVIMNSSASDESEHRFVKISSIIYFSE